MKSKFVVRDRLKRTFERQLKLCNDLETVADKLPGGTDRQFCLDLAQQIGPVLRDAHATEEQLLFPGIVEHNGVFLVERLRLEHIEDECFGEEVRYELLQLGQGRAVLAPEATGYMLRGFFEGMRRHTRHELELLSELSA